MSKPFVELDKWKSYLMGVLKAGTFLTYHTQETAQETTAKELFGCCYKHVGVQAKYSAKIHVLVRVKYAVDGCRFRSPHASLLPVDKRLSLTIAYICCLPNHSQQSTDVHLGIPQILRTISWPSSEKRVKKNHSEHSNKVTLPDLQLEVESRTKQ